MKNKQKRRLASSNLTMLFLLISIALLVGCAKPGAINEEEIFFQSEEDNAGQEDGIILTEQKQEDLSQEKSLEELFQSISQNKDLNVTSKEGESVSDSEFCYVYICGYVQKPGVYELRTGSRLYEAIDVSGGFLEGASENYCNLAQILEDGKQYYIPSQEEVNNALEVAGTSYIELVDNSAGEETKMTDASQNSEDLQSCFTSDGKLDINMATITDFQQLNGVGEIRARAIFEYREENGPFKECADIMKVSGIKEGTYKQFKDQIIVR